MTKKMIGILSGIGAVAVTATAIAVPLSLRSSDYEIPGKIINDEKITNSKEYTRFVNAFKDQVLGITDVDVDNINDDEENLIVVATGKNKTKDVKVIFNVVKTTGKTTILEIEEGPSDTKKIIVDAIKANDVSNTEKLKIVTTQLVGRIKKPDIAVTLSDAKVYAKDEINTLVYPVKNDFLHDLDFFDGLATAKQTALVAIGAAATNALVDSVLNLHKTKINTLIKQYNDIKPVQALSNSKFATKNDIWSIHKIYFKIGTWYILGKTRQYSKVFLESLQPKDRIHEAESNDLFNEIILANEVARKAIDKATTIAEVYKVWRAEKIKVTNVLNVFKETKAKRVILDAITLNDLSLPSISSSATSVSGITKPTNGIITKSVDGTSRTVSYTFRIWEANDAQKSIFWIVTLSYNGTKQELGGTITKQGASPIDLTDKKIVDDYAEKVIQANNNRSKTKGVYSNIVIGEPPTGVSSYINYDYYNGISMTFSKGDYSKIVIIAN